MALPLQATGMYGTQLPDPSQRWPPFSAHGVPLAAPAHVGPAHVGPPVELELLVDVEELLLDVDVDDVEDAPLDVDEEVEELLVDELEDVDEEDVLVELEELPPSVSPQTQAP